MAKWQKVGEIGGHAGLCMVGDPCYVSYNNHQNHPVHNWQKFCNAMEVADTVQLDAHLGVVVTSGIGDGIYPVYIKRSANGTIMELKVVF